MFADQLAQHGQRTALILENGEAVSYQDLATSADAVFDRPGAPTLPHVPIAIECVNALSTLQAYLGALRRRIPALLMDATLHTDMRSRLYQRFQIAHVWTAEGAWQATGMGPQQPAAHPDLALLLSTSGSTGEPKLVKLTAANLQANAASIVSYLGITPDERPITTLPVHYSYGLSVINSHLLAGATILLTDKSIASAPFWPFFKAHDATSLSGVPATYAILRKLRFERMSLPSLRTLTQAGGAMPLDDVRWYAEQAQAKGLKLVVMYGQTEATARMAYIPPDRLADKMGAIGIAIPGGQLHLVNEQGEVVTQPREQGELRYTGPNVMMGYACDVADLALPDQQHQVLRTGDLGWQDEDGYLYITGRLKRFIKVFGNRIGLDEVESHLKQSGFDVAVTGRDDLLVVACRETGADTPPDTAALSTLLVNRYRLHPTAIKVALIDAFPLSSSGKVQYQELLKLTAA